MTSWRDTTFFGMIGTLTEEQKIYLDAIQNPEKRLIIVNAPAGTGKTTLAVGMSYILGKGLLYLFNPTEENTLGYTPGEKEEKERKYLGPLKDALLKINQNPDKAIISERELTRSKQAWVIAKSHVFERGTNIEGTTVLIDEAQNWTKKDLKKILTRIHDNCKVIVIGHTGQIDLPDPSLSGFTRLIEVFKDKPYAQQIKLTKNFRGILSQDAEAI